MMNIPLFERARIFFDRISTRQWVALACVSLCVLYGLAIFHQQSAVFDGQRVFWLQDDMMISMRYGQNLARGNGLVWNPGGDRVEGYSNFGWVLLMAAVHLLPLPAALTSLPVMALNVALAALILALAARLMRKLSPGGILPPLAVPALLSALALSYDLARWAIIGLETTLQTVIFLWLLLRVLEEAEARHPRPPTFLLAGMMGVVRVDGLLLAGLLWLLALALNPQKKQVILFGLLALILPLVNIGFRLWYYGQPLPNTYTLKMTGWPLAERLLPGLKYVARVLRSYGLVWALAGWMAWRSRDRRARLLWVLGLALFGYAVYVGGDDFGGARFFAPWLPALLVMAFLAPGWLAGRRMGWYFASLAAAWLALVGLAGFNFFQGVTAEASVVRAGLALRQIMGSESSIAVFPAGALPYFAERPAVDLLGKNDAYIAGLPALPGIDKPGHNKYDFDYSLGELQPDVIVSVVSPAWIADPTLRDQFLRGEHTAQGQIFLFPQFQNRYAPSLAIIEGMSVFVRADSPEQSRLMTSRCEAVEDPALIALGMKTICRRE